MANLPFGPHRVIDRMSALSDLLETGALEDVYVPLFRETVHCDWCGTILPGMNGDPATHVRRVRKSLAVQIEVDRELKVEQMSGYRPDGLGCVTKEGW